MALGVKTRVVYILDGAENRVLIDEHRRQHRLLGVLRVRRTPIPIGITRAQVGRYRVFDGRVGHLPRSGASSPDSGEARRGDTSLQEAHRNTCAPVPATCRSTAS